MLVRPPVDADFPAVAEITNHAIRTTAVHFAYEPIPTAELVELWEQGRDRYPWLVAEIDGRVAGYAKAGPWRTRDAYAWTAETTVYIHPDHHRRGIGRALYARLLEILRSQGFHMAIGGITLPNEASVGLHEAMGFRHVGTHRQVGWKFERWHDVGFWQLPLRPLDAPPEPLRPVAAVR